MDEMDGGAGGREITNRWTASCDLQRIMKPGTGCTEDSCGMAPFDTQGGKQRRRHAR